MKLIWNRLNSVSLLLNKNKAERRQSQLKEKEDGGKEKNKKENKQA